MVGAAEQRADLAGRRLGVGRRRGASTALAADVDARSRRRAGKLLERLAIDVGDEVAEPIDAQRPRRAIASPSTLRLGQVERLVVASTGRPSAVSCDALAPATRRPARSDRALRTSGSPSAARTAARSARRRASAACSCEDRRQHAVVGRDEPVVAGLGREAAARRSDAGIDDDEEDRAGGKVLVASRPARARRPSDVVRRDVVG